MTGSQSLNKVDFHWWLTRSAGHKRFVQLTTHSREEAIRQLAYEIWEKEGFPQGRDMDHYLQAEQIVATSQTNSKSASTKKAAAKKPTRSPRKTAAKKIA